MHRFEHGAGREGQSVPDAVPGLSEGVRGQGGGLEVEAQVVAGGLFGAGEGAAHGEGEGQSWGYWGGSLGQVEGRGGWIGCVQAGGWETSAPRARRMQ